MSAAGCPFCARRKRMPGGYRLAWTLLRVIVLLLLLWYVVTRSGSGGSGWPF
jgi:hypothetical protein